MSIKKKTIKSIENKQQWNGPKYTYLKSKQTKINTHKWSNGIINRLPLKSRLSDLIKKNDTNLLL